MHVGVRERLYNSAQLLAATMGMRLDGSAWEVGCLTAQAKHMCKYVHLGLIKL